MEKRRPRGSLEAEVLAQLWTAGTPCTPGEVLESMGDELAYTTVMTILNRLWRKGLVERQRSGRAYAYHPRLTEAELAAQRMRATLDHTSDRRATLAQFVDALTRRDERALRRILDDLDADQ